MGDFNIGRINTDGIKSAATLAWRPEYVAIGYGQPVGHSPVGDVEPGTSVTYEYGVKPKYDENGNYIGDYGPYELEEVQTQPSLLSQAYRRYITGPLRREGQEISNFWDDYTQGHKNMVARNPYFESDWDMMNNINQFLGVGTGGLWTLTPSNVIGLGKDLYNGYGWDAYSRFMLMENPGLVTEEFAQDHPYWTAGLNLAFDLGTPLVVGGVRNAGGIRNSFRGNAKGKTALPIEFDNRYIVHDRDAGQFYMSSNTGHGKRYLYTDEYRGKKFKDYGWHTIVKNDPLYEEYLTTNADFHPATYSGQGWMPEAKANRRFRVEGTDIIQQTYDPKTGKPTGQWRYTREVPEWKTDPEIQEFDDMSYVIPESGQSRFATGFVQSAVPSTAIAVSDIRTPYENVEPQEVVVVPIKQYVEPASDDIDEDPYKIVRANDMLWNIVKSYFPNATNGQIQNLVGQLAGLNDIKNPNVIYPGDTIRIPKIWIPVNQ